MSSVKIIQAIKRELKSKGIGYRDLALYLKMSEAGVKKLLSKDDISLNKLEAICNLLQSSPIDILNAANEDQSETHTFSERQIKFFLSNKHYFHFFMKLAYEQKKPKDIQAEYKLSAKSLNSYLKKLEELGLLKRHPYDRMQIIGGIPLAIRTKGTDLELVKYEIALEQLHLLKEKKSDALQGAGLFLTETERDQFYEKLLRVVIDFSSISRTNRKKSHQHAKEYTFMSFLKDGSMFHKIIELN